LQERFGNMNKPLAVHAKVLSHIEGVEQKVPAMPTFSHTAKIRQISFGLCVALVFGASTCALAAGAEERGSMMGFAPSMFHSFRETLKKATPDFDFKIWASDREKALKAYRKSNFKKAHKLFNAAAEDGDLMASWWLGRMYQLGQGVPSDHAMAFTHFRKVAMKFDGTKRHGALFRAKLDSLVQVGRYFRTGIETANILPQPERALRIFRKAAQYSHPGAQFNIGDMMFSGEGTRQRKTRGVRWIMLAARKHYAPAQAKLGDIYMNSASAENRQVMAFMWYTLATTGTQPEVHPEIYNRYDSLASETSENDRELARELALDWSNKYPSPSRSAAAPVPAGNQLETPK
jgi:TPR repeat protein